MPVAASPCSTSSSSLGFHQTTTSSMSSSTSDLINSSNSSFGESSTSSVRSLSTGQGRHHEQSCSSSSAAAAVMPRVRTIRLKRPTAHQMVAAPTITGTAGPTQSRNQLILGSAAATELIAAHSQLSASASSSLFGFSLRGGSEYRTGFFVSHVEPASEADVQGVQVSEEGDGEMKTSVCNYYDLC